MQILEWCCIWNLRVQEGRGNVMVAMVSECIMLDPQCQLSKGRIFLCIELRFKLPRQDVYAKVESQIAKALWVCHIDDKSGFGLFMHINI